MAEPEEMLEEEQENLPRFSDASGQTYVLETIEAVEYEYGWHAMPSNADEAWFDPSLPVEKDLAISIRVSKTCWRQHMLRGLPGGRFVSEQKETVTILATCDDLWSIAHSLRWIRESPDSPAIDVPEEQKHSAMLMRKAAHQLDGRLHRIIDAWDLALDELGSLRDELDIEEPTSPEDEAVARCMSDQHHEDLENGKVAVVSISDGAAMLLEEIGIEPDIPHPDAPTWGPGKIKVTPGTLDDLEQRSAKITDPVALDGWKQAMRNKQAGGRSIRLESARKYGWGGIMASQVASVGRGLARQIAKARTELDGHPQ